MVKLQGVFTALVTPFSTDGSSIDIARLRDQIGFQALAGIDGIVPCGTTGETPSMTEAESRQVIETAIAVGRGHNLTVIAGAGSNSTAVAVDRHRFVMHSGAHAALHVCPYYNRPTQEGLYRHFMTIADSAELPVVLYDVPARTGVSLTGETIAQLALHPNIQAIKDATGSLAGPMRTVHETDLVVLSGDDPLALATMSIGAHGVVSVLSNIVPARVARLIHNTMQGRWHEARQVHGELMPLCRAILGSTTNPVGIKTAMRLLGRDAGALRLPLCEAPTTIRETIAGALTTAGLLRVDSQAAGSPGHIAAKITPVTTP